MTATAHHAISPTPAATDDATSAMSTTARVRQTDPPARCAVFPWSCHGAAASVSRPGMSGDFIRCKDEAHGTTAVLPREVRERAIRMVAEAKGDYPSEFAAIESVARRLGIGSPETLRKWIRRRHRTEHRLHLSGHCVSIRATTAVLSCSDARSTHSLGP